MLSKKMAFSLMSLITILALAFVTAPVMAAEDFDTTFTWDSAVRGQAIEVTVTFGENVGLTNARAGEIMIRIVASDGTETATKVMGSEANADGVLAFLAIKDINPNMNGVQTEGKVFTFTIPAASTSATAPKTTSIQLFLAKSMVNTADLTDDKDNKVGSASIGLTDMVSDDVRADLPKVVSIQRLRPGSQTVVSAFQEEKVTDSSFNVRIVLTEHPHGPDPLNAANLVEVENGVPSNLVVGQTFSRIGPHATPAQAPSATEQAQTLLPHPIEGMYWHSASAENGLGGVPRPAGNATVNANNLVPLPTTDDNLYRQYRVTITPHAKKGDPDKTFNVKIKAKNFHDNGSTVRNTYVSPGFGESANLPNGREILTVKVAFTAVNLKAGYRVVLPEKIVIPAGGYLVIAQNALGSEVVVPPGKRDETPKATDRTPAQLKYNVYETAGLPNLATAFLNGVVVDVESQHPGLVISEVMWGEDVSLDLSSNSQYIELYNPGGEYKTVNDADHTPDINEALTLIFYAPNEFSAIAARAAVAATATAAATTALPAGITDRIGTLDAKGAYWSPATKGQSGRSGTEVGTEGRATFGVIVPIVSMYRGMVADTSTGAAVGAMMPDDGQMAASWISSEGPKSANFDPLAIGVRHGTPGAATDATSTPADTAAEAKAKADAAAAALKKTASTGTMPEDGQIYISEIMFAGGGILPQWIEISNGSRTEEINLSGWTLTVDNAAADADVSIGATATFTISDGTTIDASGQQKTPSTILVVTEAGRNNVEDSGQVLDLMKSNEVDLILAGVVTRKYTLLSGMAFMVTLAPPEPEKSKPPADETAGAKATRTAADKKAAAKRKAATDMVGNLGADGAAAWALPMSEDGRSSIIRRHVQVAIGAAAPDNGTMMDSWVLASETSFAAPTHIRAQSYYGAANDVGTPGFRAGGALPVELSHFRPARDKVTGAVVITWSTQSELNNAGFFIKRSQQRDGEFKVINATMIQGAGTSSEKQFYTYQDTTAQPNVVYYYQIEDVSLDGNRQTLTNGIRLKGHVSVAGKLTTLWGDLKTSQ